MRDRTGTVTEGPDSTMNDIQGDPKKCPTFSESSGISLKIKTTISFSLFIKIYITECKIHKITMITVTSITTILLIKHLLVSIYESMILLMY